MPAITKAMAVQLAPFELAVPVYAVADGVAVALSLVGHVISKIMLAT